MSPVEPVDSQAADDDRLLFQQACDLLADGRPEAQNQAEAILSDLLERPEATGKGRRLPELGSYLAQLALGHPQDWILDVRSAAVLMLTRLWWEQAKHQAALSLLQARLTVAPWAEGYHQLARWRLQLNLNEEAVSALGQALQQDPAYLPAYEDLAWLANLEDDSQLAYRIVQQAMEYELTPRLFEELLIASSRSDYIPMRSLFLELCVRHVSAETRPLLIPLLRQLYAEGDFHHTAYLGAHLLQVFPSEREVLNLYVLAMLRQEQYVPALQALLQAPEAFFRQAEHWFKLGVAYSLWQMPDFARFALTKARSLSAELSTEADQRLAGLPEAGQLESLVKQVLKQMLLQPDFVTALRESPEAALARWGLKADPDLLDALAAFPAPGLNQPHDMMHAHDHSNEHSSEKHTDSEEQEGDTGPV